MTIKISQFKQVFLSLSLILAFVLFLPQVAGAVELNINNTNVPPPANINQPVNQDLPLSNQSVNQDLLLTNQPPAEILPLTNQPVNAPAAAAQPTGNVIWDGLKSFGINLDISSTDPRIIAARLIKIFLGLIGIIFLVLILLSGLRLMLSGGDEERVGEAKRTFFNAVIGLIIMLCAYSIVNFIISALGVS